MTDRTCTVEGCATRARNGTSPYCEKHYSRVKRHGAPNVVLKDFRPLSERWVDHVAITDADCWLWQGTLIHGYGVTSDGCARKNIAMHRYVYEQSRGTIPDGLEIDHLCRNRACVNPGHLEPVTHAENVKRGVSGINNRIKTHCPNGHPYDEFPERGPRACSLCRRAQAREWMRRYRAQKRTARRKRAEAIAS